MRPRSAFYGLPSLTSICLLMVAANSVCAQQTVQAAKPVSDYVKGRCAQEMVSFMGKALTDRDVWDRLDQQMREASQSSDVALPVAVWGATAYAVIDNAFFTSRAQKMSQDKRGEVADSLEASVNVMRCLSPTNAERVAFISENESGTQRATELQQIECVLPWADKLIALLRSDQAGDTLGIALDETIKLGINECERKG